MDIRPWTLVFRLLLISILLATAGCTEWKTGLYKTYYNDSDFTGKIAGKKPLKYRLALAVYDGIDYSNVNAEVSERYTVPLDDREMEEIAGKFAGLLSGEAFKLPRELPGTLNRRRLFEKVRVLQTENKDLSPRGPSGTLSWEEFQEKE